MSAAAFLRVKKLKGGGIVLAAARHNLREIQAELGKAAQDGLLAMKHCETLAKALPHDEQREFLAELPTMTGRTRHDLLAIIKGDLMHRTREAKRRGAKP